jgi:hypothetical protein
MPANFNKLIASLGRVFAAAKANGQLADLEDSIDINGPTATDMFNQSDKGNTPRSPTSPPEAASGAGGAAMVARYSDPQEGNGITEAYRMFAESIGNLNTRMEKSERGLQAVAMLLANAMGKGKEASEMFESDPDEEGKDDPDGNSTEKGKVRVADVGGIENLMKTLMGTSRSNVPDTLVSPPNLSVLRKASTSIQDILDQDDGSSYPMHARMEIASIQAAMANLDGGMLRDTHLSSLIRRASPQAREALVKANITF